MKNRWLLCMFTAAILPGLSDSTASVSEAEPPAAADSHSRSKYPQPWILGQAFKRPGALERASGVVEDTLGTPSAALEGRGGVKEGESRAVCSAFGRIRAGSERRLREPRCALRAALAP